MFRTLFKWGSWIFSSGCLITIILVVLVLSVFTYNFGVSVKDLPWEHIPAALEDVHWHMTTFNAFSPLNVVIPEDLRDFAKKQKINEADLKAIYAAAINNGILPEHLLGIAKIETGYCKNIGGGIAIDEVKKRVSQLTPYTSGFTWWVKNISALNNLAKELSVNVRSIPGSYGAGAISCFQLMPINWQIHGGGDYRNTYLAADHSAKYLLGAGYKTSPTKAFYSYNHSNAYVGMVVRASRIWSGQFAGVTVSTASADDLTPTLSEMATLFLEFWAARATGKTTVAHDPNAQPNLSGFVDPYPGSYYCGNPYGKKYATGTHWGIDMCKGVYPYKMDWVYASHSGTVIYAGNLSRFNSLAAKWWVSGITVAIEAQTADGISVFTLYGHGLPGTLKVSKGQTVTAGQKLFMSDNTGYSNGHHLHFGMKIDGKWVNPKGYIR